IAAAADSLRSAGSGFAWQFSQQIEILRRTNACAAHKASFPYPRRARISKSCCHLDRESPLTRRGISHTLCAIFDGMTSARGIVEQEDRFAAHDRRAPRSDPLFILRR